MKRGKLFKLMMPLLALTLTGCGTERKPEDYQKDKKEHWIEDVAGSKGEHEFEAVPEATVAATCKQAGSTLERCKVCGYEKSSTIKKLDHEMIDDAANTRTATCAQEGAIAKKCKNCDYTESTPVAKTAHTLGAGVAKDDNGKAYYEYECSTCHNKVESRVKFSDAVMVQGTLGDSGSEKGKFSSSNNGGTTGIGSWTFQLPAGEYDVYFDMKYSTSGEGKTLSERGVKVTLNGANVSFDDTVSDDVIGTSTSEFKSVTFCSITATGGVDVITLQNPYYRYVFDYDNGYVAFVPKASA
jgi:hypothetical protein